MNEGEALRRRIEQLQGTEAAKADPARLAQLQALVARLPGQRQEVRAVLQQRIAAAIEALAPEVGAGADEAAAASPRADARAKRQRASLAAQSLQPPQSQSLPRMAHAAGAPPELASVIRFRRAWTSGRAQESVVAATARKPDNAGPLNSHVLVLRSLEMMRGLPGDYLRRFLTHVESLQWLEVTQAAASSGQKTRRTKPKRAA